MRVLDSLIALKNSYSFPVKVLWEVNKELFSPFDKLFSPFEDLELINVSPSSLRSLINKILILKQKDNKDTQILILEERLVADSIPSITDQLLNSMNDGKIVIMETFSRFYQNISPYSSFKLIEELQEKVTEGIKDFNDKTIGIHIRRTDNVKSISYSPIELFIKAIEKELEQNEAINFYLASDDIEVKKQFKKRFGNIIITNDEPVVRFTIEGMQAAAVELYILSHTSKILGSYWSSFSRTASEISRIPFTVITNNK